MGNLRLKILTEARNILEQDSVSPRDREALVKLLDILTASLEKLSPGDANSMEATARELINQRA